MMKLWALTTPSVVVVVFARNALRVGKKQNGALEGAFQGTDEISPSLCAVAATCDPHVCCGVWAGLEVGAPKRHRCCGTYANIFTVGPCGHLDNTKHYTTNDMALQPKRAEEMLQPELFDLGHFAKYVVVTLTAQIRCGKRPFGVTTDWHTCHAGSTTESQGCSIARGSLWTKRPPQT
jgi:hypothetical protein